MLDQHVNQRLHNACLRRQFIDVVVVNPATESYRTIRNEDLELDKEGGQSFAMEHRGQENNL
jgi:hypothetical protein